MVSTLDLSSGKEHRVSVEVNGWTPEHKSAFSNLARQLNGVTNVRSAGGATSFYVYYDPALTAEDALRGGLTEVARSIGAVEQTITQGDISVPANALTIDGDPLTINGEHIIFSDAAPTAKTSDWTGMVSVQERIIVFKQLAPVALSAVEKLIVELEAAGDNGGPPLDERQEAIDALRHLHTELGNLLAVVDRPGFVIADGEGLAASVAHFAIRAGEKLRNDPIPVAVSGLAIALCTSLGFPGIGGWLGTLALLVKKGGKEP